MTDLSKEFRQLEVIRRRERGTITMLLIAAGAMGLFAIWILILAVKAGGQGEGILEYLSMGLFILAGWIIYRVTVARNRYRGAYKSQVIPALVRSLQPGMTYQSEGHFSDDWFYRSGLYKQYYNIFESEDYLTGSIGETDFKIGEIKVQSETTSYRDGRKETDTETIFDGLFAVAEFPRECRGSIFVVPDFAERHFAWLGRAFQKLRTDHGEQLLRVENPEFEKAFVVRATDPVEAIEVLTPELQEQILILRSRFGRDLRLAFKPSQLFIAIPSSKDWFEPRMSRPASCPKQIRDLLRQLTACFQIVEDLNLNTRIWTEE